MANYQYVVKYPERWDNIAFKAYGEPGLFQGIIEANPEIDIVAVIPQGTILNIPVLLDTVIPTATEDLPPWLQ